MSKSEIAKQLLGMKHSCIEYNESNYLEHYDLLRDADEFAAAASIYADEKDELLANSLHRYQQIVDKAARIMKVDTSFLLKKKVSFNFYTDIANLFGLGTQAYTTETEEPYIGISELSLQDIYLLQLVLLHELQHAIDFVKYDGLNMGIAEKELRARITICCSLSDMQKQFSRLYKNAYVDQAYWFVILFKSPNVDSRLKKIYFDLLEKKSKNLLSDDEGVVFSPLILRVFSKELERENIDLKSNLAYKIVEKNNELILQEGETENVITEEQLSDLEDIITNDLITSEDEPLSEKISELAGEDVVEEGKEVTLVKNKLVEWHTYEDEFKELKKQASVVITRNAESFSNVIPSGPVSVPKVIKVEKEHMPAKDGENELTQLKNLSLPNTSFDTGLGEEVILPKANYKKKKTISEEPNEDEIAQDMMSNLSQFVTKNKD